ncbi:PREDICTED: COX assembly mitochondrial protein 1-like [Tarenaya hassleriana]|uniref:COX assembly mitochondrial protein 1-like n=1 Tax=Tarenaya hassleriana TaxID=28532 RepID=UPI00053C85FC|nr:PREDICTED: COX assembly mitochondrial protein 1-like [Tarenaya hassleriana]
MQRACSSSQFSLFPVSSLHSGGISSRSSVWLVPDDKNMHPPLTLHRHPMCADVIEEFQKCHIDHPIGKFFGECTELKVNLDRCFRQEKAVKRKANLEKSKELHERLRAMRKETTESVKANQGRNRVRVKNEGEEIGMKFKENKKEFKTRWIGC